MCHMLQDLAPEFSFSVLRLLCLTDCQKMRALHPPNHKRVLTPWFKPLTPALSSLTGHIGGVLQFIVGAALLRTSNEVGWFVHVLEEAEM